MSKTKVAGWVLSLALTGFLIAASMTCKLTDCEGKEEMLTHLGYSTEALFNIGILEVTLALLFLIPRIDLLAAILLTAYLGGATATNVRVGDPFFLPVIIGIGVWAALILRRRELLEHFRFGKGNAE